MKTLVVLILGLASSLLGGEARRPNLLFIYTDDQRWDAVGVVQRELGDRARFPWFQTPNLDRLAQEGVRLRAGFNDRDELTLAVDDQPRVSAPLRARLTRDPNDGMQIGADLGSKVLGQEEHSLFTGTIECVRLYSGELK